MTVITPCSLLIRYLKRPILLYSNPHATLLRSLATPVPFPVQPSPGHITFQPLKHACPRVMESMLNPELIEFFQSTLLLPFHGHVNYLNSLKGWGICPCPAGLLNADTY